MLNIVVAHRGEELRWISALPAHCAVTIYTADTRVVLPEHCARPPQLIQLAEAHGTSEIFLDAVLRTATATEHDFTVFCEGDLQRRSPALLELLRTAHLWADVQPLSCLSPLDPGTPVSLQHSDIRDWIGGLPVLPLRFDLHSWNGLGCTDTAMQHIARIYREVNDLPAHAHLSAHFLSCCGLTALAQQTLEHDVGICDRGTVFAVRQSRIKALWEEHGALLPDIAALIGSDELLGRIWDRFWLHLFGLPLVRLEALPRPTRAVDITPEEQPIHDAISHALASIDATLARHQVTQRHTMGSPFTRTRHQGQVEVLAQHAAQAFRHGELPEAILKARAALNLDPQHTGVRFTLAMALAAQGETEESMQLFEQLVLQGHEGAQSGQPLQHPSTSSSTNPGRDRSRNTFQATH